MTDILAIAIMIVAIAVMIVEYKFFKKQRRKIQKYPYFKLRDQIISAIVESKDPSKYDSIYSTVNFTVNLIKYFNFNFYSAALERYLSTIIKRAAKANFVFNEETLRIYEPSEISAEAKELGELLIKSARENSLLLRLAMTKIGFNILFTSKFIKSIIIFLINKWNSDKFETQYEVIKGYSYLNHKLAV